MKKKFILPIIMTPIAATVIIATACGDQSEAQKPSGWIPKEERVAQIKTVDLTSVKEEARSQKYVLITDKGDVHDKSFNQSSWETLNQLYDQTGAEVNFIQPSTENYTQAYNQALSQGYTVWILSGFTHSASLKSFIEQNYQTLVDRKIQIIGVDFSLTGANALSKQYPYFFGLLFKFDQSAWIVGYATAKYLAYKYPNDADKRIVASFAGGDNVGTTRFNTGFAKGVLAYNQDPKNTVKVKHQFPVPLDSGYETNEKMQTVITSVLSGQDGKTPTVVLPVAGPATGEVLNAYARSQANADKLVIGVDVDQSLSYPDKAGKFLTSITKNIAQAEYDIMTEILLSAKNSRENKFLVGHDKSKTFTLEGTFAQGWAGFTKSHLTNAADRAKMDQFLTDAENLFKSKSQAFVDYISDDSKATEGSQQSYTTVTDLLKAVTDLINQTNTTQQ